MGLIYDLEQGIQRQDYDLLCRATGQLKAVAEKRFKALPNVLTRFITPEPAPVDDAAKEGVTGAGCILCGTHFEAKTLKSVRCPQCQAAYNKTRRNELTKAKYQGNLSAPVLPEGYMYLVDWAKSKGHTKSGALKLMTMPHLFGAIKVRNPKGGQNVWAVPKGTEWPEGVDTWTI